MFLWIRATSSIHSRHPCIWLSPIFVIPVFSSLISLAISSMRFAYSISDSTPPCLMLSLIFIGLVFPNLVLIFAVRFLLMFFTRFHSFSFSPLLLRAYSMAFSHALSYAFVTSRNAMCRSWFLWCFIIVFRIRRWSAVDLPFWPPAWASEREGLLLGLLNEKAHYTW